MREQNVVQVCIIAVIHFFLCLFIGVFPEDMLCAGCYATCGSVVLNKTDKDLAP